MTVFEAFHALGGVLRYGIPEFRLPNHLIDDVVAKISCSVAASSPNFVVGKTATRSSCGTRDSSGSSWERLPASRGS